MDFLCKSNKEGQKLQFILKNPKISFLSTSQLPINSIQISYSFWWKHIFGKFEGFVLQVSEKRATVDIFIP